MEHQLQFERQGHVMLRNAICVEDMEALRREAEQLVRGGELTALRHRLRVLCPGVDAARVASKAEALALLRQAHEDVGFLQLFNSHRRGGAVHRVATGEPLARAAADLLGCHAVRLYQDCLFVKQPGMSETNWHSDLRMTPLDTNHFVTMWIPLRDISARNDSGLEFALGSHRDFAAAFWRDMATCDLSRRGYKIQSTGAMRLGDVSCHHGWTLHAAPHQHPSTPARTALAVSYFADGARLLDWQGDKSLRRAMRHDEDLESYQAWLPTCKPGSLARHASIPVVYQRSPDRSKPPR